VDEVYVLDPDNVGSWAICRPVLLYSFAHFPVAIELEVPFLSTEVPLVFLQVEEERVFVCLDSRKSEINDTRVHSMGYNQRCLAIQHRFDFEVFGWLDEDVAPVQISVLELIFRLRYGEGNAHLPHDMPRAKQREAQQNREQS
jgi:hypothetical protein